METKYEHKIERLFYYDPPQYPVISGLWPEILPDIRKMVEKAEARAKKRLLPPWEKQLSEVVEMLGCGLFAADGGRVCISYSYPANVSFLYVVWMKPHVRAVTFRDKTWGVPYGRHPQVVWQEISRDQAFQLVWPDQYDQQHMQTTHKLLSDLGLEVPNGAFDIVDLWPNTPAALVVSGGRHHPYTSRGWLLLPGIVKQVRVVSSDDSISNHVKQIWQFEPQKPNIPWDEIEAEILLRELGR